MAQADIQHILDLAQSELLDGPATTSPTRQQPKPVKRSAFLSFQCLRASGTCIMHWTVVTMCIGLTVGSFMATFHGVFLSFQNKLLGLLLSTPYLYLVINYVVSYVLCIISDPGRPPTVSSACELGYSFKTCQKCSLSKPDRTHHCSLCGKCCLKYDHHCPWVANCVGFYNYGYFLKFVGYGTISCAIGIFIDIVGAATGFSYQGMGPEAKIVLRLAGCMVTLVSLAAVSIMFVTHIPLVLHNETTFESPADSGEARDALDKGRQYRYPYDMGLRRNLIEVFGQSYLKAILVPCRIKPYGDGMHYHTFSETTI